MLVLSSPSGAGKTSIANQLIHHDPYLSMSISVTTRPMRNGEIHGKDYFFTSEEEFKRMIAEDQFLEHAKVFGHYYGTPKAPVFNALEQGQDILFDIDWQGTQQIAQIARDDLVTIFILPPSLEELEKRLLSRNTDSNETIKSRMQQASAEISHWPEYRYAIINHSLEESIKKAQAILTAERLRRERQIGLAKFVNNLRDTII